MIVDRHNAALHAYTLRGAWVVDLRDMTARELCCNQGEHVWSDNGRVVSLAQKTPAATYLGAYAPDCPAVLVAGFGIDSIDFSKTGPNGKITDPADLATVARVALRYSCASRPPGPPDEARPPGVIWDDREQRPPPAPTPPPPVVPDRGFSFPWWPVAVAVAFFAFRGSKR